MLPIQFLQKRFVIKIVYSIISNINAIPYKYTLHYRCMSIQQILTGNTSLTPKACIRAFAHAVPSDDTTKNNPYIAGTYDALYLKLKDDGLGHWVFKIKTIQPLPVHQVIPTPMSNSVIKQINQAEKDEGNPEGLLFVNKDNTQILDDFDPVEHLDDDAIDST